MQAAQHRGHVVAGDARTAQAGAQILAAGGNAVDAAVGSVFAACVAEPVLTGPFGGGFGLVAGPKQATVAYDFFATIPGRGLGPAKDEPNLDFQGLEVSFGPTTQVFHGGRGAAATPRLLPGLMHLHQRHGRLPFPQVIQPAVALAEKGTPLSDQIAPIANILTPILRLTPEAAALFAPQGAILKPGEVFHSPDLASFLKDLAGGHWQAAQSMLCKSFGPPAGRITAADVAKGDVYESKPVQVELGPYTVMLNPPPSLGGLLIGFGLTLLANVPPEVWQDETQTACMLLACMAATQKARFDVLDDAVKRSSEQLFKVAGPFLSPKYIDAWRAPMQQVFTNGVTGTDLPEINLGSTTHVSAIDKDGMACSITTSNGEGCGHVVPGAGAMANNFLGEEDINPAGFHVRPAGERMTSMMCPTIVLKDGVPILALGTGGSNRIRTALLQVLVHHLLRKVPLEAAVKHPRMHYEGGALFLERAVFGQQVSAQTLATLAKRVSKVVPFDAPNMFFGGVHVANSQGPGVGDPRRGGAVGEGSTH